MIRYNHTPLRQQSQFLDGLPILHMKFLPVIKQQYWEDLAEIE